MPKLTEEQSKYTISMPFSLYEELGMIAGKHNVSIAEVIRKWIKLGIWAEKNPIFVDVEGEIRKLDIFD